MGRRIITAIDVGSSKIATVVAYVDDNEKRPVVIGVHTPPSRGVRKGSIVNIEEATDAISESITAAEKMAGTSVVDVYVSINGEQITSINNKGVVAVSAGNEITVEDTFRAIENAKTLTLPQNVNPIHIIPRNFVVDNQGGIKYPIGMSGMRLEVDTHIITAPMSSWQNLYKCIQMLGYTVQDLVFTGWASSQSVITETEKELGVTVLDIGAGTTTITVFEEGSVVYSGCIALGGMNVTSDIAIGLQVSLEDAEKIKINMEKILNDNVKVSARDNRPSLLVKKDEPQKSSKQNGDMANVTGLGVQSKDEISKVMLKKIVEARLEEIFDIAKDSVSKAGYNINTPAGVVITGGSSRLIGIEKVAQSSFGVPARKGFPSGLGGMTEEISGPEFSVAQGLIKYAAEDEADHSKARTHGLASGGSGIFGKVKDLFKNIIKF